MNALIMALGITATVTFAAPAPTTYPAPEATSTIERMIDRSAERYGISPDIMREVLQCESTMKPYAVGDDGTSFGIAQIHLPAHPEVTKDQALDADFSIDWMAKEMAANRSWQWTCWNNLYGKLSPPALASQQVATVVQ